MVIQVPVPTRLETAVSAVVADLVQSRRVNADLFVSLPLLFPSGTAVTVKISGNEPDLTVTDGGFAYRELEFVGAERAFGTAASRIAAALGIACNARAFSTTARLETLHRAICDVAAASWRVVDHVCARLSDPDDDEAADALFERLQRMFGADHVAPARLRGASSSEWDLTACVDRPGATPTVFQAVGRTPDSVYRATAAFHDLAALDAPPNLVAVVADKAALGAGVALLARTASVIQDDAPDDTFIRVHHHGGLTLR